MSEELRKELYLLRNENSNLRDNVGEQAARIEELERALVKSYAIRTEGADKLQARLSEAVKVLEEAAGKIDMQDVRLAVGEGNLTARDIINGVNAVLSMRRARSQAFLATLGEESDG